MSSILDQIDRSLADDTVSPDAVRWTPDGEPAPIQPQPLTWEQGGLWFDRQGQSIDAITANTLLMDRAYQRVALTRITSRADRTLDWRVSTVWLGTNYNFLGGPPIIFETMVFGRDGGEQQWRWCTENQAIAGHAQAVAKLAATVPRWRVEDCSRWFGPSHLDARYRQRQRNRRKRR
jgi:hypothetical protein